MLLFWLCTDPSSMRPRYIPTAACTTAAYERTRKALGGIHLVENALWQNRHFDHLMQELKDPVHGNEHGKYQWQKFATGLHQNGNISWKILPF